MKTMVHSHRCLRVLALVLVLTMSLSLAACGEADTSDKAPVAAGKALIVYFSWSPSGNTERLATILQQATGADILRLEPAVAYPSDYSECAEVALVERDENARPEIANLPETLGEYETVFVGYPIWWHTAPMLIGTFMERFDWNGRNVYPFAQSASMDLEQFANSMDFVRECAKGATVHEGLFASADDAEGIRAYLTENGFINREEEIR